MSILILLLVLLSVSRGSSFQGFRIRLFYICVISIPHTLKVNINNSYLIKIIYIYIYIYIYLKQAKEFSVTKWTLNHLHGCTVHAESGVPSGGLGVQRPLPPKFRSFDKVEPDCKLSGKCLVFLFQHPN